MSNLELLDKISSAAGISGYEDEVSSIVKSEYQKLNLKYYQDGIGSVVGESWIQNQALDSGTNPPAVAAIIEQIKDYTLGYKLPGAGGGGYLYMVAKDPQAAGCIRRILTEQAPNPRARFVEMTLSDKGLQVSRS